MVHKANNSVSNTNQPPALEPYNIFMSDPILPTATIREGAKSAFECLSNFGTQVGSTEVFEWGQK